MRSWAVLLLFLGLHFKPIVAERKLPAELQVDLLFTRANERYAPTQWFPLVFGIRDFDAVWPLDIPLDVSIWSMDWRVNDTKSGYWQHPRLNIDAFYEAFNSMPTTQYFFHTPIVNMTNGTIDDFVITWNFGTKHRCESGTQYAIPDGWSNRPDPWSKRVVMFSTASDAQLPDIENTLSSCSEPDEETSVALNVTDVLNDGWTQELCPVFDPDITPTKCAYKPVAKEIAANVSTLILDEMGCKEGTWQTIETPCLKKPSSSSRSLGLRIDWMLVAFVLASISWTGIH